MAWGSQKQDLNKFRVDGESENILINRREPKACESF